VTLAELKAKFEAAKAKALAITDAAITAERALTDEEQQQVMGFITEAKGYDDQRRRLEGDNDVRRQLEALGFSAPEAITDQLKGRVAAGSPADSLGDRFVNSDQWKGFLKGFPNGRISDGNKFGMSPPVEFRGYKDLLTGASDTSAGAMVFNDVIPGISPLGRRPLGMRNLITQGTTNSDTVEDVQVTAETNNAAPVAEATDVGGSSGVKPQSNFTMARVTYTVKTIAHWIATTKRALADAGQLRTLIDNFLRFGLEEELEDQMISGSGVGENFTGLKNISGTQDQAWDTDLFTTTLKGRDKVKTVGRSTANAFLFHPNDWQRFLLLKNSAGDFYAGTPFGTGPDSLWVLPVVTNEGVTEGTGWVGDFRQLVLWDREQATIQVSDSHSDFFIRNLVAILAEMRAAFGCRRPVAFVEMDLTA
jgi:HK97 family phage major capsid protein